MGVGGEEEEEVKRGIREGKGERKEERRGEKGFLDEGGELGERGG